MERFKPFLIFLFGLGIISCQKENTPISVSPDDYHSAIDKVIEIQVHDIFSPPVASRIFAYSNIAAYETMRSGNPNYTSLAGQMKNLEEVPAPRDTVNLNFELAAIVAYYDIAQDLIFSEEMIINNRDSLYNNWEKQNPDSFEISRNYGLTVAEHIRQWMKSDNYAQTRTMSKFSFNNEEESRWQPTPPTYMDGIEPHWNKLRPFVLSSADQFAPLPPPEFSMEKGSEFYEQLMEVYTIQEKIVEEGDESEMLAMAQFWDCNPYVSTMRGHLMFATKKISPGAHWMGITKIANRKSEADFMKSVYAYTKTSLAIADGFISCWDEKYRSNLIRPETLINKYVDENWTPLLQTPPFPEYPSGHSVVSTAAAVTLTEIFGENFGFKDDTEIPYGLPVREFTSFNQAASEAAISRLYGGIHYRAAIEQGVVQGKHVGEYVVKNLKMAPSQNPLATN